MLHRVLSVLQRRDPILFLKSTLKMTLTGETQIAAYDTDRFVRVLKQLFCFFHLTAQDKGAY